MPMFVDSESSPISKLRTRLRLTVDLLFFA